MVAASILPAPNLRPSAHRYLGGTSRYIPSFSRTMPRTPSGVSYVVGNPAYDAGAPFLICWNEIGFASDRKLRRELISRCIECAPAVIGDPRVVPVCPPAPQFAFSHTSSGRARWACPLVEGGTFVEDDRVFMRTTGGLSRSDVIYYRRIVGLLSRPEASCPSMLGCGPYAPPMCRKSLAGRMPSAPLAADDKEGRFTLIAAHIRYYRSRNHYCRMSRRIFVANGPGCATAL